MQKVFQGFQHWHTQAGYFWNIFFERSQPTTQKLFGHPGPNAPNPRPWVGTAVPGTASSAVCGEKLSSWTTYPPK